jgi:hypothetical protein
MKESPCMPTLAHNILTKCQELLTDFAEANSDCNFEQLSKQGVRDLTDGIFRAVIEAGRNGLENYIAGFDAPLSEAAKASGVGVVRARHKRIFLTLLGPVTLERSLFYKTGESGSAHVPLDEAWGMTGRYVTPDVARRVLGCSADLSPRELSEILADLGTFTLSAEAINDIINGDGARLRNHVSDETKRVELLESQAIPPETEIFVAGADGVNLLVREAGKKQGRPKQRPGGTSRAGEAETSSFKNAMVGSFCTYRSVPADADTDASLEPERLSSGYTAKMPEERFGTFKLEFEQTLTTTTNRLPPGTQKIFLCDGGRNLWKWASQCDALKDFKWMLDYFHVTSHLALAAEAIYGKDIDNSKHWFEKWCHKLKHEHGAPRALQRSMHRHSKKTIGATRKAALKKQQKFFKKYQSYMDYAKHVEQGLPIGSGPLEAACKMLVKQRLCRAGMRWSKEGGANVLNLRVLKKSGQWENAWKSYEREELGIVAMPTAA